MPFAKSLGENDFIPGDGWLQLFKDHYAIVFKSAGGEVVKVHFSNWRMAEK